MTVLKIREVEDEDWQERDLQSCMIEEVSAYGPSRGEMNCAKDRVRRRTWKCRLMDLRDPAQGSSFTGMSIDFYS